MARGRHSAQKGIFEVFQTSPVSCFGINCRELLMCMEKREMMTEIAGNFFVHVGDVTVRQLNI